MLGFAATLEQILSKIKEVLNPVIVLLISLGVVVFIAGVVRFMAQADNPEAQETGKRHILWGIIGLTIMVGVFGIINLILSLFRSP